MRPTLLSSFFILLITLPAFASDNRGDKGGNDGPRNNSTNIQNDLDNDVVIDSSFETIYDYEESAGTAYTSVASWCHSAAGAQTRSMGISITTRAKVCELLEVSRAQLELANSIKCEEPEAVGKGGVGHSSNRCTTMRDELRTNGLNGIRDAHAEASRPEGILKRIWRKVW